MGGRALQFILTKKQLRFENRQDNHSFMSTPCEHNNDMTHALGQTSGTHTVGSFRFEEQQCDKHRRGTRPRKLRANSHTRGRVHVLATLQFEIEDFGYLGRPSHRILLSSFCPKDPMRVKAGERDMRFVGPSTKPLPRTTFGSG